MFHYVQQRFQAAEPKKATPTPPAATEAAQAVKGKEEPKVAAKTSEQATDNKPASVASHAGDDAASMPKKLEKRNSIQLFFKNLVRTSLLFHRHSKHAQQIWNSVPFRWHYKGFLRYGH